MKQRVTNKQPNSDYCLVCGLDNPLGLQASFFETEKGELVALCRFRPEHQGYPGRLHGGLAAALLDETIGRAVSIGEEREIWGVSVELTTQFRKPVPLQGAIRVVGRITCKARRFFEGTGEILLEDGSVAARGRGKYMVLPLEKIAAFDREGAWRVVPRPDDPEVLDV